MKIGDPNPENSNKKEGGRKPPVLGLELTATQLEKLFKILDSFSINTGTIELPGGTLLKVEFIKNSSLLIKLLDKDKVLISDFDCMLNYGFTMQGAEDYKPTWRLAHRFVAEQYRGQEIGPKMLRVVEQCIEHIAEKSRKSQTIVIDAFQLAIIDFAIKNDYEPASEEDKANAEAILSGDRSKVIISDAPAQPDHSEKRQNVIYSVDKLREAAKARGMGDLSIEEIEARLDELMDNDFYSHKKNVLMINFKKDIKPAA